MTGRSNLSLLALPQDGPAAADEGDFMVRAARVARIAAEHADAVDRDARFPVEAMAALRDERLLGLMIPLRLGGEERSVGDLAEVCLVLGRACASTAMIFAMHQIKIACLVVHGAGSAWHEDFLRSAARAQWLLASSTTEGAAGGAVRSSVAPVVHEPARIRLERAASVMSYGLQADAVVTTARRSPTAAASDQVLVVFPRAGYSLERTQEWDTLGMRGTCSAGFAFRAEGTPTQILPEPYADIHTRTMTPTAHLLWSAVWTGIASAAFERARMFVRRAARASGQAPPGAAQLGKAARALRSLHALLGSALARWEEVAADADAESDLGLQSALTLLKVDASELAVEIVTRSLRTCGLSGYRNDGEASLGRHLRDVLSAPLMINNERILADAASSLLLTPAPSALRSEVRVR